MDIPQHDGSEWTAPRSRPEGDMPTPEMPEQVHTDIDRLLHEEWRLLGREIFNRNYSNLQAVKQTVEELAEYQAGESVHMIMAPMKRAVDGLLVDELSGKEQRTLMHNSVGAFCSDVMQDAPFAATPNAAYAFDRGAEVVRQSHDYEDPEHTPSHGTMDYIERLIERLPRDDGTLREEIEQRLETVQKMLEDKSKSASELKEVLAQFYAALAVLQRPTVLSQLDTSQRANKYQGL